jgi:acetyl-CoA carboxylase carboxyltransferase component
MCVVVVMVMVLRAKRGGGFCADPGGEAEFGRFACAWGQAEAAVILHSARPFVIGHAHSLL